VTTKKVRAPHIARPRALCDRLRKMRTADMA
jgi:hypothetical protein